MKFSVEEFVLGIIIGYLLAPQIKDFLTQDRELGE